MALINKLTGIADALRAILNTNDKYTLNQMASLIRSMSATVETKDIVKTITEFDIAKYGNSLYKMQCGYMGTNFSALLPKKQIHLNNFSIKYDNNTAMREYYMPFSVSALFPDGEMHSDYYDVSNQNVVLNTYDAISFIWIDQSVLSFTNFTVTQKFSFMYEDSTKVYTTGIGFVGNTNLYSYDSTHDHRGSYANRVIRFSFMDIKNDKLYLTNGNTETEICSLEPDVVYDVEYTGVYTEDSNVSTNLSYTFKINEDVYTDDITFSSTDSLFSVSTKTKNMLAYTVRENCPEMLRWYSSKITSVMEKNVIQNYFTMFVESKLCKLEDGIIPGAGKIGKYTYYLDDLPYFESIDLSAQSIGAYAFYQSNDNLTTPGNQLKSIVLPNVKTISQYAFADNASNITDVALTYYLPVKFVSHVIEMDIHNVQSIGNYAFDRKLLAYNKPLILNRLTSLGTYAFRYANITSFEANSLLTVPNYAFAYCYNLRNLKLDSCTSIGEYSFTENGLENIDIPECTIINAWAFEDNKKYQITLNAPNVTTLKRGAFNSCNFFNRTLRLPNFVNADGTYLFNNSVISEIQFDKLVYYNTEKPLFNGITALRSVYCPLLVSSLNKTGYTEGGLFCDCCRSVIEELDLDVSFPSLTYYKYRMFSNCNIPIIKSHYLANPEGTPTDIFGNSRNLNQVWMHSMPFIGASSFQDDYGLEFVYFGNLNTMNGSKHFNNCVNLEALIIATNEVCTLGGVSANCAFNPYSSWTEDREGYIYVPEDLIEDYKSASNWSTYADRFRAIEDYGGVQGIYKIIYPEFENTLSITQTELLEQLSNGTITSNFTLTKSNVCDGFVLEDFEGDDTEYIFFVRNSTTGTNIRAFFDLPSCKDFSMEFDCVFLSTCFFNIEFGWDNKYLTANDVTNMSACASVYSVSINNSLVCRGVNANGYGTTAFVGGNLSDSITIGYPDYSNLYRSQIVGKLAFDSINRAWNYYGHKQHIKITRYGKFIKIYMNNALVHKIVSSTIETDAGGYFALSLRLSSSADNNNAKFGIANMVLKYGNRV